MCLILVGWRAHRELPLIVAANRDEFHGRPAAPAAFWNDQPGILAGRDLQAGGTWMGVSRAGKFAAVTNYRGAQEPSAAESRGALVARYLADGVPPARYVAALGERAAAYSGFNLLVADDQELWWMSNRDGAPRLLEPGIYGLGNAFLDSPDVAQAKARFLEALQIPAVDSLFTVLARSMLVNPQYGTRCATILLKGTRIRYAERSFSPDGAEEDTLQFEF